MNSAFSVVFLSNLPKIICKTYEPNTGLLHMFNWFIAKYGKTTTKNQEENGKQMAANWHPSKGFEPFAARRIIGVLYVSLHGIR